MDTLLITQKNICAFLGLIMAVTIVWKANVEQKMIKKTAQFEITKQTNYLGKELKSGIINYEDSFCEDFS